MSLEVFIDIHKNDSPIEKISVLMTQIDILNSDRYNEGWFSARDSVDNAKYFYKESLAIHERIKWLLEELKKDLKEESR